MALALANSHGRRLRKRYGKVRSHLFIFLEHLDAPPDNNGCERELRPTATYRKVREASNLNGVPIYSPRFDPSLVQQHDAERMLITLFLQC
jgi:hypothetical protein